eukprot:SAG22_NODE_639_length_8255_cov_13.659882_2_plen_52_part_00
MCEDWPRLPPEARAVLPLFGDFGLDYTLKAKLALINPTVRHLKASSVAVGG